MVHVGIPNELYERVAVIARISERDVDNYIAGILTDHCETYDQIMGGSLDSGISPSPPRK